MILQNNNHVETSEKFEELTFGVREEDMGVVLEVLRSKMYSNPIGSICREISCNARDANREVGKAILPIEIKIEDSPWLGGDLAISFKDAGPGISPDRIANVFVNYGASTKRTSNEFNGGFGLGAKTPFSYTDSFVIITIVDGNEYVYVAAIEEGRRGKLFVLNKQETTEANGTSIVIPIKSNSDRIDFEQEVYNATIQWDIVPKYIGFNADIPKIQTLYVEEKFRIIKESSKNSIALLIDGIYYPFDNDQLATMIDKTKYNFYNGRNGYSVLLEFKTGDLTVSANRENVQYDKQTVTKLKERLDYFISSAEEELKTWLRSSKNIVEAAARLSTCHNARTWTKQTVMYSVLRSFEKEIKVTYPSKTGEVPIRTRLSAVFPDLTFQIIRKEKSSHNQRKRSEKESLDEDFLNLPLFWFDMTGLSGPRNRTIFSKHEEFLLVQPPSALTEWKTFSFNQKKRNAKSVRSALKSITLLTEVLNPSKYSSIEGMSIERRVAVGRQTSFSEKDKVIYGRVRDGYQELKIQLQVEDGEIKSMYGEGSHILKGKKGKIFYVVADSLRPLEAKTLDHAFRIVKQVQSLSDWVGLIVNEKGEKLLRNSLTHYKVVIESLHDSLYNLLDLKIEMEKDRYVYGVYGGSRTLQHWIQNNYSILSRFRFEDVERNNLLKEILKIKHNKEVDLEVLIELMGMEYKRDTNEIIGYEFSEKVKGWKEFLNGLRRKYPLVFTSSSDASESDINTYICAIDLLLEKVQK